MFSRFFFPCSRCRRCWKCCCGGGLGRNRRGRGFCKGETETTHNGPRKTLKVGNSCTCTAPTPILATQRKGKLRWRSARCRELRMSLLMAPQLMDMRRPRATRREKKGKRKDQPWRNPECQQVFQQRRRCRDNFQCTEPPKCIKQWSRQFLWRRYNSRDLILWQLAEIQTKKRTRQMLRSLYVHEMVAKIPNTNISFCAFTF